MLIVERYTTNRRLSNNVITELETPVRDIENIAEELLKAYVGDARMVEGLDRIMESVASMRARLRSCTAGPQTILGAESVLHQEELEPVLSGRHVLVADDEPMIRQTICAVLEQRGCSVEVCTDGTSAIDSLNEMGSRDVSFDLVISDVRMPDRNGYEVFRAAKNLNTETPVILMTGFGYDPHHSIVRSSQEGLHCFLFKPFQIEQLLEEVYKALVINPSES
jgi:CheY-like chemotaxis protein